MRLKLISKVNEPIRESKKFFRLRLIENKQQLQEASRKNPVDTVTNRIKNVIAKYLVTHPIDTSKQIEIDFKPHMEELIKLSPKFNKFLIDKLDVSFYDLSYRGVMASYNYASKTITIKILKRVVGDLSIPDIKKYDTILQSFKTKQIDDAVDESLYHEATHASQYGSSTGRKKELSVGDDTQGNTNVFSEKSYPLLDIPKYYDKRAFHDMYYNMDEITRNPGIIRNKKTDATLNLFFYLTRPIEIDARIKTYRLNYRKLKQKNKDSASNDLSNFIIQTETEFSNRITSYDNFLEKELRTKCLYQFFYQLKRDAKDIFSLDTKFQEELDKYSSKCDEINSQIISRYGYGKPIEDLEIKQILTRSN